MWKNILIVALRHILRSILLATLADEKQEQGSDHQQADCAQDDKQKSISFH